MESIRSRKFGINFPTTGKTKREAFVALAFISSDWQENLIGSRKTPVKTGDLIYRSFNSFNSASAS
jgi:hypothetical protein